MSREIRRVPLDWEHPTDSSGMDYQRLYAPSYSVALKKWQEENELWNRGEHEHQAFLLKYHSPLGYVDRDGVTKLHPYSIYSSDEETIIGECFFSSIEDILKVYPFSDYSSIPEADAYMPDFPFDTVLGYCLYETVSEGTPTTPVFSSEVDLIEHLTRFGESHNGKPLRRESAEALVLEGGSFGSMMIVGNKLLDSTADADKIRELGQS